MAAETPGCAPKRVVTCVRKESGPRQGRHLSLRGETREVMETPQVRCSHHRHVLSPLQPHIPTCGLRKLMHGGGAASVVPGHVTQVGQATRPSSLHAGLTGLRKGAGDTVGGGGGDNAPHPENALGGCQAPRGRYFPGDRTKPSAEWGLGLSHFSVLCVLGPPSPAETNTLSPLLEGKVPRHFLSLWYLSAGR